jgi:hypothetical protein
MGQLQFFLTRRVRLNAFDSKQLTQKHPFGPHRAQSNGMNQRLSNIRIGVLRAGLGTAIMLGLLSAPAFAQGRPVPVRVKMPPIRQQIPVPKEFAPPTGMCRIWIDGVPADQQPAPTDCATAVKNRPVNGKVIFSDEKATSPKPSKKKKDDESSL